MSPGDVWSSYVKHIGAGAVAAGGIFALVARAAVDRLVDPRLRERRSSAAAAQRRAASLRTDRDTPMPVLVVGALAIVAFIWLVPAFQMTCSAPC